MKQSTNLEILQNPLDLLEEIYLFNPLDFLEEIYLFWHSSKMTLKALSVSGSSSRPFVKRSNNWVDLPASKVPQKENADGTIFGPTV